MANNCQKLSLTTASKNLKAKPIIVKEEEAKAAGKRVCLRKLLS
jgi:hypothetical protein